MEDYKIKKGKQKKYVNKLVKNYDEESVSGENLFGDDIDYSDISKKPYIIQLGNLLNDRTGFTNPQGYRVYSANGCCMTLDLCDAPKFLIEDNGEYRIRRLSGVEELMLMGVERDDVKKIQDAGLSDVQMRKLAGNSIIVDIMSAFFKEMIKH